MSDAAERVSAAERLAAVALDGLRDAEAELRQAWDARRTHEICLVWWETIEGDEWVTLDSPASRARFRWLQELTLLRAFGSEGKPSMARQAPPAAWLRLPMVAKARRRALVEPAEGPPPIVVDESEQEDVEIPSGQHVSSDSEEDTERPQQQPDENEPAADRADEVKPVEA